MGKWDFIKRIAQKASLKAPNRSDRFKKVLVNNADKVKMSDLENLSETDFNKMYMKQLLKDNKVPIAGAAGIGAGYALGKNSTEGDEDAPTGFENIDELSPELLDILKTTGYIYDPDDKEDEDDDIANFEAYGDNQADIIDLLRKNGFDISDEGKYTGPGHSKLMKILIENGYAADPSIRD